MPGSNILHYGAVRVRVVGDCKLQMEFQSMQDDSGDYQAYPLKELIVTPTTRRKLDRLANVVEQGARLKFSIDGYAQYFKINDIVIYAKEQWKQFPG